MKLELARAVVAQLQISGRAGGIEELGKFALKDWQRTYQWLDDSGLALYLLRHLQNAGSSEVLPAEVLARLQDNCIQNHSRCAYIADSFAAINELFRGAGVPFAVIKGLSLVPEYCPDAVLRAPSDVDYLVDPSSLLLARRVLEGAGYRLQKSSDIELKFYKPSRRMPTLSDSPYSVTTEPLIEVHTGFWHRTNNIPLAEPLFSLEQAIPHTWEGLHFRILNSRDAFLLQVLHVFQHTVESWVKLSWLLEIGNFLSSRSSDSRLWCQLDDRMNELPILSEFAAIVIELARILFSAPIPDRAQSWISSLRSTSRLWLDQYAETFAFDDHPLSGDRFFPTGKLSLFLHQEYISNPELRKEMIRRRLFPWKRPDRVAFPGDQNGASMVAASQLQLRWMLDRIVFHLGSGLRYLWEVPRWRNLTS